jgi:hypothetical protein
MTPAGRCWASIPPELLAADFGTDARGIFHLPGPNAVLSIESDGSVNGCRPGCNKRFRARGSVPLPAGPAVDRRNNCWYFRSDVVMRHELAEATHHDGQE